jgi:hypothetical protein
MDKMQEYYKSALLEDLCSEYKGLWQAAMNDKESLLKLSLCQQAIPHVVTFAYEGKGLTREYVKENFREYINGHTVMDADGVDGFTYGLYADYDYDNALVLDKDVCSVMWTHCDSVFVPKTKAVTLYVSNRSDISIVCDGYNSLRIYLFDESKVTLEDVDDDSTVTVYNYGKCSVVERGKYCLSGHIQEFRKQLRL